MLRVRWFALPFFVALCAATADAQVATRAVAIDGDPAPGGGTLAFPTSAVYLSAVPVIAGDTIVFVADVVRDGQPRVPALFAESGGSLRLLARWGEPLLDGDLFSFGNFYPDTAGNVFVAAHLHAGSANDTIVKFTSAGPERLAGIGDVTSRGTITAMTYTFVVPDGAGGAYFQASFDGGEHDSALLHADGAGGLEVVVASGQTAPAGGTYSDIYPTVATGPDGQLVFGAAVDDTYTGLFSVTPAGIVALAEPNFFTLVSDLPTLAVAAGGNVAFQDQRLAVELATPAGVSTIVNGSEYVPRVYGYVGCSQVFGLKFAGDDLYILAPIRRDFGSDGTAIFRRKADGTIEAAISDLVQSQGRLVG